MMTIEKGKLYLVTGATGFLGEHLTERILELGGRVRAFSRNEGKLIILKQRNPSVEIYTGDVSDWFEVKQAMLGVDAIFHLAALKQVSGVYGATKLLMERLFLQCEKLNPNTKYRIVRYGNVLYSTGSVLCKWKDLLLEGKQVIVTEPKATRFFWTREQAVDLIFSCLEDANDSTPWVPEMKSMEIGDLLTAMAEKYLPEGKELNVKYIGLQPAENMHEKILEEGPASDEVDKFTIEEIRDII